MKSENVFTNMDHAIIRAAVRELPGLMGYIVDLRFWRNLDEVQISEALGLSIHSTEILLARALRMLREHCLKHPAFSRSKYAEIKMIRSERVA